MDSAVRADRMDCELAHPVPVQADVLEWAVPAWDVLVLVVLGAETVVASVPAVVYSVATQHSAVRCDSSVDPGDRQKMVGTACSIEQSVAVLTGKSAASRRERPALVSDLWGTSESLQWLQPGQVQLRLQH